jgi:hypothetical protein
VAMSRTVPTVSQQFQISVHLPPGYRFNSFAPSRLRLEIPNVSSASFKLNAVTSYRDIDTPISSDFAMQIDAKIFYCEDQPKPQCYMKDVKFTESFTLQNEKIINIVLPNPKA